MRLFCWAATIDYLMSTLHSKKIVWIYEDDHSKQPFICLAKEWLVRRGHSVVILDSESPPLPQAPELTSVEAQSAVLAHSSSLSGPVMVVIWTLLNWTNCGLLRRVPGSRWAAKLLRYFWLAARAVSEKTEIIVTTGLQGAAIGWMANLFRDQGWSITHWSCTASSITTLRWWWRPFERAFVKRGIDALVTQNDERARIYVTERGSSVKPTIVHNYKQRQSIVATGRLRQLLNLPQEVRIVLYEGLLGRGRWLDNLALSAAHLPEDARLVFLGRPSEWWVSRVQPILSRPEIAQKVLMAPWVQHAELLQYVADADVGVIIYDDSVRNNYYCRTWQIKRLRFGRGAGHCSPFPYH